MEYFDYRSVAREARLSARQVALLRRAVAREFPGDPMLQELHLLRVCSAIRDGRLDVAAAMAALAA
jgi:hypothetical protein